MAATSGHVCGLFGDEHPVDPDREFSPVQWFITLFLIPLATVVVSGFAHREARRGREDEAVG